MSNDFWKKVKNYIGIGLLNGIDTIKKVEVSPPDAPDLHDVVAKKPKAPRKTKKKE